MKLQLTTITLLSLHAAPALGQTAAPEAPRPAATAPRPSVIHAPQAMYYSREPIVLRLDVLHPDLVDRVTVRYRVSGAGPWREVPAARRPEGGYRAEIPAQPLPVRTVDYYITLNPRDGGPRDTFGSADAPHTVVIHRREGDEQEALELALNDDIRLESSVGGEYTNFGSRPNLNNAVCGAGVATCEDFWYSIHGSVRYHFFRTVRSVSVRGEWLSGRGTRLGVGPLGEARLESNPVGLVAATVEVEFRLARILSFYARGILGANEIAVQTGAGGTLEFGVGTPARVQLSFNGIVKYGIAASAWMRWDTIRSTPLGAGIEITNQPVAGSDFGIRLLFEAGRRFGRHAMLVVRGGYGARLTDASGFTAGGYFQLGF